MPGHVKVNHPLTGVWVDGVFHVYVCFMWEEASKIIIFNFEAVSPCEEVHC